jgi:hypothetical protein
VEKPEEDEEEDDDAADSLAEGAPTLASMLVP